MQKIPKNSFCKLFFALPLCFLQMIRSTIVFSTIFAFATLGWATRFFWYLARAARWNFGQRQAGHPFSLVSGNAGTTLGQRWCKKHEGRAIHWHKTQWYSEEKLAKNIFRYFFAKTRTPKLLFFLYVRLTQKMHFEHFFRLGENFSVRGHGAKFLATLPHQLFKQMVGTPHGSAGLGKNPRSNALS